jgi:hypothetical protein
MLADENTIGDLIAKLYAKPRIEIHSCDYSLLDFWDMSRNRNLKTLVSAQLPVHQGADEDNDENWAGVVHGIACNWREAREWHPDDDKNEVSEREDIDGDTPAAEVEGTIG